MTCTHQSCQFRRSIDKSNPGDLRAAVGKSTQNGYLPCTLIVTDRNSAYKFDEEARRMHDRMTGVAIPRGEISVEAYEQIAQFFESLKNQGNTR